MAKYEPGSLSAVFSALADPTRRAMTERLRQGEASVGELAEPFELSLPTVTKHLKALEHAGLVENWKTGRVRRCRLVPVRRPHRPPGQGSRAPWAMNAGSS